MSEHERGDFMKKEFTGWLGGDWEDLGFFETKKDAERGLFPDDRLHYLFEPFKGKLVKITVELAIEPYIKECEYTKEGLVLTLINDTKFLLTDSQKEFIQLAILKEIEKIESESN